LINQTPDDVAERRADWNRGEEHGKHTATSLLGIRVRQERRGDRAVRGLADPDCRARRPPVETAPDYQPGPAIEAVPSFPAGEVPRSEPAVEMVQPSPVAEAQRVDDLKARIEETRRRIRQELEQPFVTTAEPAQSGADWTVSPAVPAVTEPAGRPSAQPLVHEPVLEVDDRELDVVMGTEPQQPLDYDSMKARIEMTRSRLKAKAFDAMMTGESALLGRDVEGTIRRQKALGNVDSEVEETIESSLREQED
jgi:hypothetical protein